MMSITVPVLVGPVAIPTYFPAIPEHSPKKRIVFWLKSSVAERHVSRFIACGAADWLLVGQHESKPAVGLGAPSAKSICWIVRSRILI
jgi:hypothetical protein